MLILSPSISPRAFRNLLAGGSIVGANRDAPGGSLDDFLGQSLKAAIASAPTTRVKNALAALAAAFLALDIAEAEVRDPPHLGPSATDPTNRAGQQKAADDLQKAQAVVEAAKAEVAAAQAEATAAAAQSALDAAVDAAKKAQSEADQKQGAASAPAKDYSLYYVAAAVLVAALGTYAYTNREVSVKKSSGGYEAKYKATSRREREKP